jgi:hypothetical protein
MAATHHLLLLCYIDRLTYRLFVKYKAYVVVHCRMNVNEGLEGRARTRYISPLLVSKLRTATKVRIR